MRGSYTLHLRARSVCGAGVVCTDVSYGRANRRLCNLEKTGLKRRIATPKNFTSSISLVGNGDTLT